MSIGFEIEYFYPQRSLRVTVAQQCHGDADRGPGWVQVVVNLLVLPNLREGAVCVHAGDD